MSGRLIIEIVLGFGCLYFVAMHIGAWLYKKEDWLERLSEVLLDIASALAGYGLVVIPNILKLIAIRDLSGAWDEATDFVKAFKKDPTILAKEFGGVFDKLLTLRLTDADQIALLEIRIAKAKIVLAAQKAADESKIAA